MGNAAGTEHEGDGVFNEKTKEATASFFLRVTSSL
jgi:hypothetical protein